ncbi:hypothetical protein Q5P01_002970 [Channa striata]|uniref:Uncharacterized protein n=1 Tax=Channa striata TaxID=64152 RepID=A0AA88NNM6_CHASR|nr:hypothetical protein Q5P01_002970 [Channa striata]
MEGTPQLLLSVISMLCYITIQAHLTVIPSSTQPCAGLGLSHVSSGENSRVSDDSGDFESQTCFILALLLR